MLKTEELTLSYHITDTELLLPDGIKHTLGCNVCADADSGSLTFLNVHITEHLESALRFQLLVRNPCKPPCYH